MSEVTAIEWCDSTFNPWIGCTRISPACDHCYAAELMDTRYGRVKWGGPRSRTSEGNWKQPRSWQRHAQKFFAAYGRRRRVFCSSLADVFDNQVPDEWRDDLWALIRDTPDLDWLLLTKRPMNIGKMLPDFWDEVKGHVWLGTTVEDQIRADVNIRHLLKHDSAVRFLSCEPLLGSIDLTYIRGEPLKAEDGTEKAHWLRPLTGEHGHFLGSADVLAPDKTHQIDWVIVGGESGAHARPSHPDWINHLRYQCEVADTPFLFKQHGEWVRWEPRWPADVIYLAPDGQQFTTPGLSREPMVRVGKKAAGRLLRGIEHNGFPKVDA